MPSSTTAMSGRAVSSMSDSGRPMWLFKLPRFRITRYFAPRNSAVTSFVVVLPALPVMATTFVPDACRVERASACNASVVSSTTMTTGTTTPESPPFQSHVRGTTMPSAPAATAASAKSAPANLSPRMPMYSSPVRSVRVSIDTPENSAVLRPATIVPAMAAATHSAVSRMSDAMASALHDARIGPAPAQQLPRDRDVVERHVLVAENLVLLVAFAGDQHHVARTRRLDRFRDGRAAIRNGKRRRVLSSGVRRNAAL